MITNAEQHQQNECKGVWRTAQSLRRCSRYFGDLACCRRAIMPGKRYFNTQENVPDAGAVRNFIVCDHCANAPHRADFLAGTRSAA
jgi:hypothetical protein